MTTPIRDVRVFVLGASLSSTSLNNRLAALAAKVVEAKGGTPEVATIDAFDCPFYDRDIEVESGPPGGAHQFCERLKAADAIMIASPEYNASVPAAIKNLIDWASRFRPQPLNGKQALLLSASPSMVGGNRGLWALRIPLEHLGTRVYPDMFSLAQAHQALSPPSRLARCPPANAEGAGAPAAHAQRALRLQRFAVVFRSADLAMDVTVGAEFHLPVMQRTKLSLTSDPN